MAGTDWESGCDFAAQQDWSLPQQQCFRGEQFSAASTLSAAKLCVNASVTLNKMANAFFMLGLSVLSAERAKPFLAFARQFLSVLFLSASRIFLMYLAGFLSKSFLQSLQQSLTSWPLYSMTNGLPISPSLSPETGQVV